MTQPRLPHRKTVGLALSSGGIRGFIHIGVLKALVQHDIPIDYIAGSSIGAWIGSYYAIARDLKAVEQRTVEFRRDKLIALLEPGLQGGIIKGKKVERLLAKWMGNVRFDQLAIPTTVVATDLISGREVRLSDGPVSLAVRASMAIPLFFQPLAYRNMLLVDGGLINPLPDNVVRDMGAQVVIGVNIDLSDVGIDFSKKLSLRDTAMRTAHILRQRLAELSSIDADVLIQPAIPMAPIKAWRNYFTQASIDDIVAIGEQATIAKIPEIKRWIWS